jgi:hypothetical protein
MAVSRRELLDAEKKHMRHGDELARQRQELPWVPVEKEYSFETDEGRKTLGDLFDGRSQLIVYHFMFGSGYRVDERNPGCIGCSFVADHFDGVIPHLNGHDVTLVSESVAPLEWNSKRTRRETLIAATAASLGHGGTMTTKRRSLRPAERLEPAADPPSPTPPNTCACARDCTRPAVLFESSPK